MIEPNIRGSGEEGASEPEDLGMTQDRGEKLLHRILVVFRRMELVSAKSSLRTMKSGAAKDEIEEEDCIERLKERNEELTKDNKSCKLKW